MKTILSSKTVWFNGILFVIGLLALPELVHVLPASVLPYDILGGAVGNLILRIFFTSQPLTQIAAGNVPPQA